MPRYIVRGIIRATGEELVHEVHAASEQEAIARAKRAGLDVTSTEKTEALPPLSTVPGRADRPQAASALHAAPVCVIAAGVMLAEVLLGIVGAGVYLVCIDEQRVLGWAMIIAGGVACISVGAVATIARSDA